VPLSAPQLRASFRRCTTDLSITAPRARAILSYRIASDTPSNESHDLKGTGAKITGGRWNSAEVPVVYTSSTRALAAFETLVHLGNSSPLPFNRYLVEVRFAVAVWDARTSFPSAYPVGWEATPPGAVSMRWGNQPGGVGIGLTLVRNLVALHGGSVEARSEGTGHAARSSPRSVGASAGYASRTRTRRSDSGRTP